MGAAAAEVTRGMQQQLGEGGSRSSRGGGISRRWRLGQQQEWRDQQKVAMKAAGSMQQKVETGRAATAGVEVLAKGANGRGSK